MTVQSRLNMVGKGPHGMFVGIRVLNNLRVYHTHYRKKIWFFEISDKGLSETLCYKSMRQGL